MKRSLLFLLAIALLIPVFAGVSGAEASTIKIGIFEPITGANAAGGQLEVQGVQLANELYPTVLGKKIELVTADNGSDKTQAATAAARLVEKDKVVAIIGSWGSSLSMAAGDIVKNAQVPTVGASCTNPLVTQGNPYYFRVCFIDPFQGTVMANYAFKNLKAKKAAIIQEVSNDYAVGLAKFFTDSFKKLTKNPNCIVAVANYNTGDQDFSAQLTNIKAKNPDIIFAPGNFTESALLISQARKLGIKCPITGGDTYETNEFLTIGGKDVEGTVFSTFFDSEKPITKESKVFLAAYYKKYPNQKLDSVTALAYDAYLVILDAIKRAKSTDGPKLQAALVATKNYPGAAGTISFDENRNAIKSAVIKVVKDGNFHYLTTVNP
jgi:branched-chain amino acid transport system substrate-binding protein